MTTRGQTHEGVVSFYDKLLSTDYGTGLWRTCPILEWLHDPSIGMFFQEGWDKYDTTDDWTLTQATTGAAAMSAAMTGVMELDSNSTTAAQGANLQRTSGPFIIPVASTKIWAEWELKIVDTYDKCELFVGLSDVETTILTGSALGSDNVIGWYCTTDDGVLLFQAEKGGTGVAKACATIAEATYIKLGVYVNGITSALQYVNGAVVGTAHLTANVPIVKLIPSFVCQSGGTNGPIMHIKGFRIFQTYA